MTIERIDFWDRCLGTGRFDAAVGEFPDEALALFGANALQQRDPTRLALIIFARRTLLMTDDQIEETHARIRREVTNAETSGQEAIHHVWIPLEESDAITSSPLVSQSGISAESNTDVDRVRERAKQILLRNGLGLPHHKDE